MQRLQLPREYRSIPLREKIHINVRNLSCPFKSVEPYVPLQGKILDYGCGHGLFSWWMKAIHSEREVVGYDISREKIAIARALFESSYHIRFFTDQEYLSYTPFDAVVIFDVLYLIKEKKELISIIKKLIKPEGFIIVKEVVQDHTMRFLWARFQEYIVTNLLSLTKGEGLFFVSTKEMIQLLQESGFDVNVVDVSKGFIHPHRLFIGRKK